MPITTNVVSSNPAHGEVYSLHHYVIMFVSDMSVVFSVSSTNKTDLHDITEILLEVALNNITLTPNPDYKCKIIELFRTFFCRPKIKDSVHDRTTLT
jgi:hypothetical protein